MQYLYKRKNGCYYVRTFAGSKKKWASPKIILLAVAKNRIQQLLDAIKRQRVAGDQCYPLAKLLLLNQCNQNPPTLTRIEITATGVWLRKPLD